MAEKEEKKLRDEISELRKNNEILESVASSSKKLGEALAERVKELNCMYSLTQVFEKSDQSLEDLLQSAVILLPPAFRYPEITGARISFKNISVSTTKIRETEWRFSAPIVLNGNETGQVEVFYYKRVPEFSEDPFLEEERALINTFAVLLSQFIERRLTQEELQQLDWMLRTRNSSKSYDIPEYGDLTTLNKGGLINSSIDSERLKDLASEYLGLLDTSAAIYEANGDYALGIFTSGWCRLLDTGSRNLCETKSNSEAMDSGKWLCHDSCWKEASLRSIREGKPVDVPCSGGLNLYAVPVRAGGKIVGSINFGYGEPPKEESELRKISLDYKIPVEKLRKASQEYLPRPKFIIDLAKYRLERSAVNLGQIIDLKLSEEALQRSLTDLKTTLNSIGDAVIATDKKGLITRMNPVAEELTGWKLENALNRPLESVFNIVNSLTGEKGENPVDAVIKTGKIVGLANHTKLISNDGKEYQIADSGAPIKDDQNNIHGVVLVFRDITRKYILEEEIYENEKQLRKAQKIGKIGSWTFDLETGKANISEESYNIYGLQKGKEYTIKELQQIPLKEYREILDKALQNLVKGEGDYNVEFRIRRLSDNTIAYIHSIAEYSKMENRVSGIIQDITERYLKEEEIKKSEEKFRLIANNSLDCIWQLDKKLRFTYLSPSLYDITGFKPEEWIGTRISQHTNWIEFVKMSRLALRMLKNFRTFSNVTFETKMYNKAGDLIPLEIASTQLFADGKLIGLQGSTRDIRNRTEAEIKLRESEEKNRFLFENMVQGVIYHNSEGEIINSNEAASRILGLTSDQLVGKTAKDPRWKSIHEDGSEYPGDEHPVMVSLKTGKPVYDSVMGVFIPEEESYRWININSIPKFENGNSGKLYQVVVTIEDITRLRKAIEMAEESDRLKSSFLANMSHEIRTPMNGIIGFANLLSEPDLTAEEKSNYIEIIQKSGDRMLSTVNDLIDISKIETGQVKIALSEVRLNEKIENLYNFFRQQASEKGLELKVSAYLEKGSDTIITDSTKLDSILSNLIKNAIKYTDKGKIEIKCQDDGKILTFNVKDTGIGIPPERLDAIFNRFEQADISNARAFDGSGLGLTIAKAYVEMLEGKIWVESELDRGTDFYFTLPSKRNRKSEQNSTQKNEKPDEEKTGNKLKIIIAEDDEPSFMYLSAILRKRINCEILHAKSGTETMELLRKNDNVDIIFMDIKMPEIDGYETTKLIRDTNREVVIIAQTAYAFGYDRERALEAGCDDYISKPIRVDELMRLLRRFTDKH